MQANGPYIWCIVDGERIVPLGDGKSLEYVREFGKGSYSEGVVIKLFKLVEVDE